MNKFWITITSLAVLAVLVTFSPYALAQSAGLTGVADTIAPVTSATISGACAQGVYTSDVIVTLSANDSATGVNYIEYSVNNDSWTRYTGPVTLRSSSTVSYRSVDMAGNIEANNTLSFKRIHISLGPGISPADEMPGGQPGMAPSATSETLLTVTGNMPASGQSGSSSQSGSPIVWLLLLTFTVFGIGAEIYFLTMRK